MNNTLSARVSTPAVTDWVFGVFGRSFEHRILRAGQAKLRRLRCQVAQQKKFDGWRLTRGNGSLTNFPACIHGRDRKKKFSLSCKIGLGSDDNACNHSLRMIVQHFQT
jgi:hypothetical protein